MDGKQGKGIGRRAAIRILTAGALGWLGLPGLARAMGNQPKPDGIHRLNGDVRINDRPAKLGDIVRAGDVIRTGPKASVLFVAGGSVHLIRDNSRITFPPDDAAKDLSSSAIRAIKTVNGKILSVFGDGPHRIETATSIAGVRGTGIYVEAEPDRTYICTCYGTIDLAARSAPETAITLSTRHHEAGKFILGPDASGPRIIPAPMINHTDKELILLESHAGRKPPFLKRSGVKKYSGNGGGY